MLGSAAPAFASLLNIGSQPQLFVDDFIIEKMENAKKRLNPAVKVEDNPVIHRDRPWEGSDLRVQMVFFDESLHKFRMRYQTSDFVPAKGKKPGTFEADRINYHVCEAFSEDGIHWDKPNLGLVEFNASKANNILPPECMLDAAIIQDLHDPDLSKRYKALRRTGEMNLPGMTFDLFYSADSYHWTPYRGNPIMNQGKHVGRWGPTDVMGWDPIRQAYAVFMEYSFHMAGGPEPGHQNEKRRRSQGRAESPDMIHWTEPEIILAPDDSDFPDTEFYNLPMRAYEGYYVGLVWDFSTTNTFYTPEFIFSRDGIHFDRDFREPYVGRGDTGAFDSVCVYVDAPIVHGDNMFVYYTGVNWRAPEQLASLGDKAHGGVGLAMAKRDSFVSIDSGRVDTAVVVTRPFGFTGDHLYVNLQRAEQGWGAGNPELRVEVLDSRFSPIEGFTRDQADPVSVTSLNHQATWKGSADLKALQGRTISLRFYFKNVKLYSFQFR
jgi:hypothetical protein